MRQLWDHMHWKDIKLQDIRQAILDRAKFSPLVGDIGMRELMGLSLAGDRSPVGIYIFSTADEIYYVGKTHGRSLAERLICHLDSRTVNPDEHHTVAEGDTWESIARARGASVAKIKKYNKGKALVVGEQIKTTSNWSMSSLVGTMVRKGDAPNRVEAVKQVMEMRTTWMRIPPPATAPRRHQEHVEVIERRLLWTQAARPRLNSERGNGHARFGVEGIAHTRHLELCVGDEKYLARSGNET